MTNGGWHSACAQSEHRSESWGGTMIALLHLVILRLVEAEESLYVCVETRAPALAVRGNNCHL